MMMDSPGATQLLEEILERTVRVGVVGLGYVGLPLAVELAGAGFRTTGLDVDVGRVDLVNGGYSYVPDVLASDLARLRRTGALDATVDFDVLAELDTVSVCVPTPLRKTTTPDLSYVVRVFEQIAKYLHRGMLIVLESTVQPGTTKEIVLTLLEATGLRVGHDFFLAFSPERVNPGNAFFNTRNIPKVIGGVTRDCSRLTSALYGTAIESIVCVSSPYVAEVVKQLEDEFRAVNMGLVNELALRCQRMNVDVWEVIHAAMTKPFGFMPFYPGPGLGCRGTSTETLCRTQRADETAFQPRLIELAAHVNAAMPLHVVELIADALNCGAKALRGAYVLIAGVAYKPNVDDIRESPALEVMSLLVAKGAKVAYSDPYVPLLSGSAWDGGFDLASVALTPAIIREPDCVAILTDHSLFDTDEIAAHANVVVDARNATGGCAPRVFRLGAPRPLAPTAPAVQKPDATARSIH